MTITVAASDANSGSGATLPLTLSSTEGNVQQVYAAHRTGSLTPDIDGTGWTQTLIETEITNNQARRAIVRFRRIVPAGASATINVGWTTSADIVVWGIEITTDTLDSTWVFDGADDITHATDNGTTDTTSLASSSITPSNNEAFAIDSLCARHGEIRNSNEDTYSDSFVVGPGDNTVSGNLQNNLSGFCGYKIVDVTPAAMSTTASWTTSALATSLIDVWSVSGAGGPVALDGTGDAAADGMSSLAVTRSVTGDGDSAVDGTASLSATRALVGQDDAAADGTAALAATRAIAGQGNTASDGTGSLTVRRGLATTGDAAADGTAQLTVAAGGVVTLTGTAEAAADGIGALTVTRKFSGAGLAAAAADAAMVVLRGLTGQADAAADGTGELFTGFVSDPHPIQIAFDHATSLAFNHVTTLTFEETT